MNSVIVSCMSCTTKNRIAADRQHLRPLCGKCKTPLDLTGQAVPVELDSQGFHDFIKQAPLPVMVDFYSPTCGPCHSMMPIIHDMARKAVNRYIIAKVDTSKNQQLAAFFNIRGVPSFIFFNNGSMVEQVAGAVPQNVLMDKLANF